MTQALPSDLSRFTLRAQSCASARGVAWRVGRKRGLFFTAAKEQYVTRTTSEPVRGPSGDPDLTFGKWALFYLRAAIRPDADERKSLNSPHLRRRMPLGDPGDPSRPEWLFGKWPLKYLRATVEKACRLIEQVARSSNPDLNRPSRAI